MRHYSSLGRLINGSRREPNYDRLTGILDARDEIDHNSDGQDTARNEDNDIVFWRRPRVFYTFLDNLVGTIWFGAITCGIFWAASEAAHDGSWFGVIYCGCFGTAIGAATLYVCAWDVVKQILCLPWLVLYCLYACLLAPIWAHTSFTRRSKARKSCQLCTLCQAIADDGLLAGRPWRLTRAQKVFIHWTPTDLVNASLSCHLCGLLLHSLPPQWRTDRLGPLLDLQEERLRVHLWKKTYCFKKPTLSLRVHASAAISGERLSIEWLHGTEHECAAFELTSDTKLIAWARAKIHDCSFRHAKCKRTFVKWEDGYYLPKRLIDLACFASGSVDVVSAATLSSSSSPTIRYLALSHCWGGYSGTVLRKSNLRLGRFGVHDLPLNFRDAIHLTSLLGYRYLWIDSLCIVQDDEAEWARESVSMGLVYANAQCVLSTTAADHASMSCITQRDNFRSDCLFAQSEAGNRALGVRWQPRLMEQLEEKVEAAMLSTRGWSFQERYLACRTLHFAQGCVIFECNEIVASDNEIHEVSQHYKVRRGFKFDGISHAEFDCRYAARNIPPTIKIKERIDRKYSSKSRRVTRTVPNPNFKPQQEYIARLAQRSARLGVRGTFETLWLFKGTSPIEMVSFHNCWFEIVEQYSKRALSRHEDKLFAISGMARFIQSNTGITFCSGLWQRMLPYNLLWCRFGEAVNRSSRPLPTWSWASIDGRIGSRLGEVPRTERNDFQHGWKMVDLHVPDHKEIKVIEKDVVNGMIFNSVLELSCTLWVFNVEGLNVIWDTIDSPVRDLVLLPILTFKNKYVHPLDSEAQLHGIILYNRGGRVYERAGYFWTTECEAIDKFSMMSFKNMEDTIILQ